MEGYLHRIIVSDISLKIDFRWMSTAGQGTKYRRSIAENVNRLSRVHVHYRQTDRRHTTDGRTTAYSKRVSRSLKTAQS